MQKIIYPNTAVWEQLCKRPEQPANVLQQLIKSIYTYVAKDGDNALLQYTKRYDWKGADRIEIPIAEIKSTGEKLSKELKDAIKLAAGNIEKFHRSQLEKTVPVETTQGVMCWRESRSIENVGIYIPGGSAPLFSTVLMLAIPARIAGCKNIVLCTPPNSNGEISPAILYAAYLTSVSKIYSVGGVQAIASMALGTESIPKVDKIFGPGNQYVTAAKNYAQHLGVAIDMPAGPSEVLVIADKSCVPSFVAADLLSQAEHGADSQVMLLTDSEQLANDVLFELERQLEELPRKDIAEQALQNSNVIVLNSIDDCMQFSNRYAPEHLILAVDCPEGWVSKVMNAGSVFLGNYSCESAGDYASGTNHTLPTNGYARNYSGVSIDSFIKKITFQQITPQGLQNIGPAIECMAEAEGLIAHKNAVSIRLKSEQMNNNKNLKQ